MLSLRGPSSGGVESTSRRILRRERPRGPRGHLGAGRIRAPTLEVRASASPLWSPATMLRPSLCLLLSALLLASPVAAQKGAEVPASLLGALRLRSVGPSLTSGRIGDFAVNPDRTSEYYLPPAREGSGRPPMEASPSIRSSISRAPIRSAASASIRRTRASFGSARARTTRSAAFPSVTASTAAKTAARAGSISG